jgi:hypothetical protein
MDRRPIRKRHNVLEAVMLVQSELIERAGINPGFWDRVATAALHFFLQFYERVFECPPAYALLAIAAFQLASQTSELPLDIAAVVRLIADQWSAIPRATELDGMPESPIDLEQLASLILERHVRLCAVLNRNLSFPRVERAEVLLTRDCPWEGVEVILDPRASVDFVQAVCDDSYDPSVLDLVLQPFLGLPARHWVLADTPIGYHLLFSTGL